MQAIVGLPPFVLFTGVVVLASKYSSRRQQRIQASRSASIREFARVHHLA